MICGRGSELGAVGMMPVQTKKMVEVRTNSVTFFSDPNASFTAATARKRRESGLPGAASVGKRMQRHSTKIEPVEMRPPDAERV